MRLRIAPFAVATVILGAAGMSLLHADEQPTPNAETSAAATPTGTPGAGTAALPPNHPPITSGLSPHGAQNPPIPSSNEAPAIGWKPPASWQSVPNPNAMRLATYRPSPDTELSVARAGGATEANIQRWIGQFDDAGQDVRTEKVIGGFHVSVVEVGGTYLGGGMTPGAASESRPGWLLVGAVVETPGSHYFFKMVGPASQVRAARASFDALLASITPS